MSPHERFAFRSRDDLAAKSRSLDLDLPYDEDVGRLFRRLDLRGGLRLGNRLAVHPMEGADAGADGAAGELTFRRYRRFAAGGCGLVWFEATAVERGGRSNPHQLMLTEGTLASFKELVRSAREAAAEAAAAAAGSPLFILQLTHSGRFSKAEGRPHPVFAQHNPVLDPLRGTRPEDSPISDAGLERLKGLFLEAAGLAAEAGFDGVDVKACHGYLLGELLAARRRPDSRYGGSFDNRTRFLTEIVSATRLRFPKLIVACRLGVYDALPYPYGFGVSPGTEDREDLSEPVALVGRLIRAGLSLLNVTAGIPALRAHHGRPFDRPAAGSAIPDEHPLSGVARLLRIAAAIQEAYPALPVVGTGYSWLRTFGPAVAAGVLRSGGASIIGLGRLSIAYPDFARDLRRIGSLDPHRVCVACSGCSELLRAGGPAGCIIRDRSVYKIK